MLRRENQFAIPLTESLPRLAIADKRFSSCYRLAQHWRQGYVDFFFQLNLLSPSSLCLQGDKSFGKSFFFAFSYRHWFPYNKENIFSFFDIPDINLESFSKKNHQVWLCLRIVQWQRKWGQLKVDTMRIWIIFKSEH